MQVCRLTHRLPFESWAIAAAVVWSCVALVLSWN
jgi:hypothetical protein